MQSLLYITFNDLRICCFIKSVPIVLVGYSELALQLLESGNAFPSSMVVSAVVHAQQSVLCAGDPISNDVKFSSRI